MSPEAATTERVYRDLKRRIMTDAYRPGSTIVLTTVADLLGTSISPVRDALQRLVGERLVEIHGGGGFAVPELTATVVHHLYGWHWDLVRLALKDAEEPGWIEPYPYRGLTDDQNDAARLADAAAHLFRLIGNCSPNPEHGLAIVAAGDRLHAMRMHEGVLAGKAAELEALWHLARSADKKAMRIAMQRYHRRRQLSAARLCIAAGGRPAGAAQR